jgi:hypothetical protein
LYVWNGGGVLGFAAWKASSGLDTHSEALDPWFVNIATGDLTLTSTSPCLNTGTCYTKTVGSGSGATLIVADARYFCDGFDGLFPGDVIDIGLWTIKQTVRVVKVDYTANSLTLDRSVTWNDGDPVSITYLGSAPDMGAFEYDSGVVPTVVPTVVPPTSTPIPTATPINTPTYTRIPTSTSTAIPTSTPTFMATPVPTYTFTSLPTSTATSTVTLVNTVTSTPIDTETSTATPTSTPTVTPTMTLDERVTSLENRVDGIENYLGF